MNNSTDMQLAQNLANYPGMQGVMQRMSEGMGGFSGNMNPGDDFRRLAGSCMNPQGMLDLDQLCAKGARYIDTAQTAYAATLAAMMAERDTRTNNAVSLTGNNAAFGATYPPGVPVPLFIRSGAALAASPGVPLQIWMQLYRLFTGDVDSQAGWQFVANSVVIGTDPAQSFNLGNVSFTSMRAVVPRLEAPLAWLYDRRPINSTTLTMSVIHFNAAPIPLVEGVTATYLDTRCPDLFNWAGGYRDPGTIFPLAVDQILRRVRFAARTN